MREVETQLRDYFDEVVERMTEEDIRIRASTARGVPVRVPRFRIRPAAALATGFGIAMTLLGGVMVAAKLLGGEQSDVGGGGSGTPGASAVTDPGNPGFLLVLMAGFGLLAFGMWSMRRSAGDVRERGDRNMQTIERPESAEAPPGDTKLKGRNRMLTWLVAILAVAVIGLGAWLVAEMSSSSDTGSLPAAAEAVMDDYEAAWTAGDSVAFLAATSEDYTFMSRGQSFSRDAQETTIAGIRTFEVERFSISVAGYGPYYVALAEQVRFAPNGPWNVGQSILTLVEENGVWKVAQHTWVGAV